MQLDTITLTANAADSGEPQRQRDVQVEITLITDVADMPPVWEDINGVAIDDIDDLEIDENIGLNAVIETFTAMLEQGVFLQNAS